MQSEWQEVSVRRSLLPAVGDRALSESARESANHLGSVQVVELTSIDFKN
jgi:hypothetical protein